MLPLENNSKKNSFPFDNTFSKNLKKDLNKNCLRTVYSTIFSAENMLNTEEIQGDSQSAGNLILPQHNVRFLQKVLNSIELGLIISDSNGDFVYWNNTALELLDLNLPDFTKQNVLDLINHIQNNSIFDNNLKISLTSLAYSEDKILNTIIRFKKKKEMALRSHPLSSSKNIYRQWILWDLTEKSDSGGIPELLTVEDEIQLYKQKSMMLSNINTSLENKIEKLIKEKNEREILLSIIAHDLKSPFQGILGTFSALTSCFDELPVDEIKTYTTYAHASVKRLYSLVDGLLEWTRLLLGQVKFNQTRCNLNYIMMNALNYFKTQYETKEIHIKNSIADNLEILGDDNMINAIFRNLISNSIKYSNRRGIITLSSEVNNGFASILIADQGTGISEEIKHDLFKPSGHTTTKGTEDEEGSGFGLLLCKEMMEWHNGSISFESQAGKGTTFRLNFPLLSQMKL